MTCRTGGGSHRSERIEKKELSKVPSTLTCYRAGIRQRMSSTLGNRSRLFISARVRSSRFATGRKKFVRSRAPRVEPRHLALGQRVALPDAAMLVGLGVTLGSLV